MPESHLFMRRSGWRLAWPAIFAASIAISVFLVIYPVFIIWPFRRQESGTLQLALYILRFRALLMGFALGLGIVAAVQCWGFTRSRWKRSFVALGFALMLAAAGLSRVNIYELMFHPVPRPEFVTVPASPLDSAEKVIAVRLNGQARAYPVRAISYHHVVNDRLGGVPIVATY